jgi:hypothetical protein
MDLALIVLGLIFIVLIMAFVINPPEAWIKRVFNSKPKK